MENILVRINSTLNFVEDKIGGHEDIAIVIIQNEIEWEKKTEKYREYLIRCGTVSSDICVFEISKREERGDRKILEVKKVQFWWKL